MRLSGDKPQQDSTQTSPGLCTGSSLELVKKAYALLAADPDGLHGIVIYAQHSPIQEALKTALTARFAPLILPVNAGFAELYGGLDSAATLASGELVKQKGLLERANKNGLLITSLQGLPAYITSILCSAIDNTNDKNQSQTVHCPKVIIGIDDSVEQEPGVHGSGLAERLALHIRIPDLSVLELFGDDKKYLDNIQKLFSEVPTGLGKVEPSTVILTDKTLKEFTYLALQLGISSMQPLLNTCRVARTLAAIDERSVVSADDAIIAVQLALAPHAMHSPQESEQVEEPEAADAQNADSTAQDKTPSHSAEQNPEENQQNIDHALKEAMQDKLVAAAQATLPHHLLASLAQTQARRAESGRDKQTTSISKSGRPIGILRPKGSLSGQRINIVETLKAAVPMQGFRRIEVRSEQNKPPRKIHLRRDDLRITRYRHSSRTTTVFVVDASGSSAMHRLAEAKGAVELLLAECYVRRDKVALITFRGTEARLDLPPTRSLTRAKRALQNLPGGGGTPLASGLQLAYRLLSSLTQDGEAPIGVFMTDAKANIALDGSASRDHAALDAEKQSQLLKTTSARLLFVDTANRKGIQAQKLARTMGANYLALPRSGSQALPDVISGLPR